MEEKYEGQTQGARARYYSSMDYCEYINIFERPPNKPEMRPIEGDKISGLSDDLNGLHLEDTKTSSENHQGERQKANEIQDKDILKEEDEENEDEGYEPGEFMLERQPGKEKQPLRPIEEADFLSDEFSASGNKIKNRNRSQSENCTHTIFSFLNNHPRKKPLHN